MTITVSPTTTKPTHHIKLSKSGTEIGLILCDAKGDADEAGLTREPYPRSAVKIYSGEQTYGDSEPPYKPISQEDWSGGRGAKTFETMATRYADAWRADATRAGKILLGGQESYATGLRSQNQAMPGSINWVMLYGNYRFMAQQFIVPAVGYAPANVWVWLRKRGTPPVGCTISLYSNVSGGTPNAPILNATGTVSVASVVDEISVLTNVQITASALTAGYVYWVVVDGGVAADITNHWEIGCGVTAGKRSAAGSTWNTTTLAPCYRVTDADAVYKALFFEYKKQMYAVKQFESGATSTFWMNGDRGTADSNSGNKARLNDSTKTWTADEWIGSIAYIIAGPGSEEPVPWRVITDNGTNYLEMANWNTTHSTATEYIIVKSDKWTQVTLSMGGAVTDIAVTDMFVYFARGEVGNLGVLRYEEYTTAAGVWTSRNEAEFTSAIHLLALRHPQYGPMLYGTQNNHLMYKASVWKARIPLRWGRLYTYIGDLTDTATPWDDKVIDYATQSINGDSTLITLATAFTTGLAALRNLDSPVDIRQGYMLGVMVKSSIDAAAEQINLLYDDVQDLEYTRSPLYVGTSTAAWANTFNGLPAPSSTTVEWDNSDVIFVCQDRTFDTITFTIGAKHNDETSALAVHYWDGSIYQSIAITDNTSAANKTMAVTGTVTIDMPNDWKPQSYTMSGYTLAGYFLIFTVTQDLNHEGASPNEISLLSITTTRKNNVTLKFPALTANVWEWVQLAITPTKYPLPDCTQIQSLGISLLADAAAQTILMKGGIQVLSATPIYTRLPAGERITGITGYAGGDETKMQPWAITESMIYPIDEAGLAIPLALGEIANLRSETNGQAHCVNGVYLYFNLGQKIQRYYNRQLDDVGPDLEEGMPADRRGVIGNLLSYPGRVIAAIDGEGSNISSVLMLAGGWHELYRAPKAGMRIRSMAVQSMPVGVSRLWVSCGSDILWIPIALNPEQEGDYRYCHEATLITARITGGMQDVMKFYKSLKLATENLSTGVSPSIDQFAQGGQKVFVDYRTNSGTTWIAVTDWYDVSPFQEVDISSTYNVSGRWIELRLRLETSDNTATPKVLASVLETLETFPVKFMYTVRFRLQDKDHDLNGDPDSVGYLTKLNQLDTWVTDVLPILMNSTSTLENGKYVKPQPIPTKRLAVIQDPVTHQERHICQLTLLEV
jgi:hypothetical protein